MTEAALCEQWLLGFPQRTSFGNQRSKAAPGPGPASAYCVMPISRLGVEAQGRRHLLLLPMWCPSLDRPGPSFGSDLGRRHSLPCPEVATGGVASYTHWGSIHA